MPTTYPPVDCMNRPRQSSRHSRKIVSTVSTGDGGMVAAEKGDLTINVVTGSETQDGFTSVITMQVAPKTK